ncbi:hypothetical protein INT47_004995 [Mucor saturninus]|uniref:Uncharacterized protein n=1 Tax=Mucor saturninus TaxID=64648 RepID=A0A8H7QUI8_9FUNG|nr:hypothetical protein INT47_004995 [Mucor saturninus]
MNTTREGHEEEGQPLKRSTYNIYEAYNDTTEDTLHHSSIHPLDATPYAFDLTQKSTDLTSMMHHLDLSAPSSMPYCL